ncbi:NADPH:quinone oxidoreductase family protein [Paracoccus sp. (in: a-proteobacteria)]|uniref:NADPH:quinone oxidoreductase family protein n=1 Tax=Paracoccus sp. TaxID=267 RepID=UPI003A88C069
MSDTPRIALVETLGSDPVIRAADPAVRRGDAILVRMHASALNFADLLKAKGQYQEAETPPFIPGIEGAGVVQEAGPGSAFAPGDRVAVLTAGTMADLIAVPGTDLLGIPDSMSLEQAAGFQIAYGTSHLALAGRAALQPGETLVVTGAAGGVGLTAVEIGHAMGARVIGVARGADRLKAVRAAGAETVIDSDTCDDLKTALRDLGGAHVVYDAVGDATGEASFGALRRGGRFLVIGFAGGRPPRLPLNHALVKNIAIHGFYWSGYRSLDPAALRGSMSQLFTLFEAGKLRPVTGETLPLTRIAEGYEALRTRRAVGKIVITL